LIHESEHAKKVVDQFKVQLGESANSIDQALFDELALMVEAAIDASLVNALQESADIVSAAAKKIRNKAEKPQ